MTRISVMSSHVLIRIYMGGLILGANTLYRFFYFFKLFPMVGKGLTDLQYIDDGMPVHGCGKVSTAAIVILCRVTDYTAS